MGMARIALPSGRSIDSASARRYVLVLDDPARPPRILARSDDRAKLDRQALRLHVVIDSRPQDAVAAAAAAVSARDSQKARIAAQLAAAKAARAARQAAV